MSKAFKGDLCAYCCEENASTADHVIARGFFPKDLRGNLPKVGACRECNNTKSQLEHALTAVMPFGARHGRATEAILTLERRLVKNQRLHRLLAAGARYVFRSINGSPWEPEMTVPFDSRTMEQLGEYMVKGLARYHWGLNIGADIFVCASFLRPEGAAAFDRFFAGKAGARVTCDLGQGVFRYEGIRSVESPNLTLWKMSVYGAEVGGDPAMPGQRVSMMYGVTVGKNSRAAENLAAILGGCVARLIGKA
jgi:hypothetical protein